MQKQLKRTLSEQNVTEILQEYHQTKDKNIRDEVIINYIYLVKKIAKKVSEKTGFLAEDLESYGYEGLIKAIEQYDITMQGSRINYITQSIRRMIFNGFAELKQFGGRKVTNAYLLERSIVENEYEKTLVEDPSLVEIILDRLIDKKVIAEENRQENKTRILLDIAASINQYKQSNELIDKRELDETIILQERNQALVNLLETLPRESQKLIKLRYGFFASPVTLIETAKECHMSPEGVRKKENRIIQQLATLALRSPLQDFKDESYQKVKK